MPYERPALIMHVMVLAVAHKDYFSHPAIDEALRHERYNRLHLWEEDEVGLGEHAEPAGIHLST